MINVNIQYKGKELSTVLPKSNYELRADLKKAGIDLPAESSPKDQYLVGLYKEIELETAANYIALYYLLIIIVKSIYSISKDKPAIIILAAKRNPRIYDIINNHCANFDYEPEEAEDGLVDPELRDLLGLALTMLKHSKWYDLADYFLAIQYVFSIVDNGLSPEMNNRVGIEMLHSCAIVNNFYAIAYLRWLDE